MGGKGHNNMNEHTFRLNAKHSGFNPAMVDFMWENLAKIPHTHEIDEVEGLQEELDELDEGEGEGEDNTDDES